MGVSIGTVSRVTREDGGTLIPTTGALDVKVLTVQIFGTIQDGTHVARCQISTADGMGLMEKTSSGLAKHMVMITHTAVFCLPK